MAAIFHPNKLTFGQRCLEFLGRGFGQNLIAIAPQNQGFLGQLGNAITRNGVTTVASEGNERLTPSGHSQMQRTATIGLFGGTTIGVGVGLAPNARSHLFIRQKLRGPLSQGRNQKPAGNRFAHKSSTIQQHHFLHRLRIGEGKIHHGCTSHGSPHQHHRPPNDLLPKAI